MKKTVCITISILILVSSLFAGTFKATTSFGYIKKPKTWFYAGAGMEYDVNKYLGIYADSKIEVQTDLFRYKKFANLDMSTQTGAMLLLPYGKRATLHLGAGFFCDILPNKATAAVGPMARLEILGIINNKISCGAYVEGYYTNLWIQDGPIKKSPVATKFYSIGVIGSFVLDN